MFVASDDEVSVSSVLEISEPDTQFVPREDDKETLWEVIEITAEKGELYKVKWAGLDPKTRRAWPQSWVFRHDCTDDLVLAWKLKKAQNAERRKSAKRASTSSRKARESTVTRGSVAPTASTVSSSTTKHNTRSSTTAPPPPTRSPDSKWDRPLPPVSPSFSDLQNLSDLPEIPTILDPDTLLRPRKKRKVEVQIVGPEGETSQEQSSLLVKPLKEVSKVLLRHEEDEEDTSVHVAGSLQICTVKGKGKDRQGTEEVDELAMDTDSLPIVVSKPKIDLNLLKKPSPAKKGPGNRSGSSSNRAFAIKTATNPMAISIPSAASFISRKDQVKDSNTELPTSDKRSPLPSPLRRNQLQRQESRGSVGIGVPSEDQNVPSPTPQPVSPILSPRAIQCLEEFDAFLRNVHGNSNQEIHPPSPGAEGNLLLHDEISHNNIPPAVPAPARIPLFSRVTPEFGSAEQSESISPIPLEPEPNILRPESGRQLGNDSYRQGVVSETETQSSTDKTQSRSQPLPTALLNPSPTRSSLISKMKLRIHRSGSGSSSSWQDVGIDYPTDDHGISGRVKNQKLIPSSKPLRPIPVISPSKFSAHLPTSSNPVSAVETTDSEEGEVEELMSSIEQFSSPVEGKSRHDRSRSLHRNGNSRKRERGTSQESAEPPENDIVERGKEMADSVRKERIRRERGEEPVRKRTLTELLKMGMKDKGKRKEETTGSGAFKNTAVRGPRSVEPDVQSVQDMADTYVNLTGSEHAQKRDGKTGLHPLAEEEEESTQDLMELAVPNVLAIDIGLNPVVFSMSHHLTAEHVSEDVITQPNQVSATPAEVPNTTHAAEEFEPRNTDIVNAAVIPNLATRQRSISKATSKSPFDRPARLAHEEYVLELPPTASIRQNTPDPQVPVPPAMPPKNGPEHLGAAMTLLNVKSEEISKLDNMLTAEQAKTESLTKDLELLRAALALARAESHPRDPELKQQLAEAQGALAKQQFAWEAERSALAASVDTATQDKFSAQKDRDFFQAQYQQASSFVSSVRQQNIDLESRSILAEEQASKGVEMVKATFQLRIKALEDDVIAWKKMAMFLMEKDTRTNNEIRRRAAEEPELRARCQKLEEVCEAVGEQVSALEEELSSKEASAAHLEAEVDLWKKETMRLNVELNKVVTKLERLRKGMGGDDDDVMVYRCQWRLESNNACDSVFLNIEELEKHLYTGGHIHE